MSNGENLIGNASFSDTKRPDKFSSNKAYHSTDKMFAKNDDQKVNKAKLTHHGCFICGADNQLIGDGHQCNTDYKNRDGKRSFRGQLYFEKAKSIPDINTVFWWLINQKP